MMATAAPPKAGPARVQRREAWREYLETCRHCSVFNYDEIEEWAWCRLQDRLKSLQRPKP